MLPDDEEDRTNSRDDARGHHAERDVRCEPASDELVPLLATHVPHDRHWIGDHRAVERGQQDPHRVRQGESPETRRATDPGHDDADREVRRRRHTLVHHRHRGARRRTPPRKPHRAPNRVADISISLSVTPKWDTRRPRCAPFDVDVETSHLESLRTEVVGAVQIQPPRPGGAPAAPSQLPARRVATGPAGSVSRNGRRDSPGNDGNVPFRRISEHPCSLCTRTRRQKAVVRHTASPKTARRSRPPGDPMPVLNSELAYRPETPGQRTACRLPMPRSRSSWSPPNDSFA